MSSTRSPAAALARAGLVLASLLVAAAAAGAQAVRYHVERLDPGNDLNVDVAAIDAQGRVVGDVFLEAVVFDTPTSPRYLPSLGGSSFATATNASGLVVGASYLLRQRGTHAVSWRGRVVTDLGSLPRADGGVPSSVAYAVNALGDIAGSSAITNHKGHAFLVHAGVMSDLGALPGGHASVAAGINDSSHVVGVSDARDGLSHAFLWSDGRMHDLMPADGSADFTNAQSINNHDVAVGYGHLTSSPAGMWSALMWKKGRMTVLGSLGTGEFHFTSANAINDDGVVVGTTQTSAGAVAFVVPPGGAMTDLNALLDGASLQAGWKLSAATGINANGEITGKGLLAGQSVAFIARPLP